MAFLRRFSNSFTDCVESVSVNGLAASVFGFSLSSQTKQVNTDLSRLQTMARLGENMFEISMKIGELDLQNARYQAESARSIQMGISDAELRPYFQRMREVNIQKRALEKSGRTLMATVSSLESQANIQQIKNVLSYTVDTHRLAREAALDDVTSESLLQGFEQISNTIEQEKMLLDNLDAHISEIREDPVAESDMCEETPEFMLWKSSIERGIAKSAEREETTNASQKTKTAPVPLVSHMSVPC